MSDTLHTPGKTFTMDDALAERLMRAPRRESRIERDAEHARHPSSTQYVMTGSSSASKSRGRKPKFKR